MTVKTPVTILQILPELNDGGVERGTIEMAAYIKTQGGKSLVASAGGTRASELASIDVLHVVLPLHRKNPLSVLINAYRLRRLMIVHGVTHIHARSRGPAWSAWLATRCQIRYGHHAKFITTFHGTHSLKGLGKKFYNSVMVRGDVVVANSEFIAAHIREYYAKTLADRPLLIAPRGADTNIFNPDTSADENIRAQLELAPKNILIIQVGRLSRWKGQAELIEALAELKNENVHLALVGASDTKKNAYLQELKQQVQALKLGKNVHFVGSQSNVAAWYRAADIAVNNSQKPEAFGRTTVESMACGTLTIATAYGGSLEIIEDGVSGILVPPTDKNALVKALKRFVDNKKERARIAAAGVVRVQENFTVEQMCAQEFEAYNE